EEGEAHHRAVLAVVERARLVEIDGFDGGALVLCRGVADDARRRGRRLLGAGSHRIERRLLGRPLGLVLVLVAAHRTSADTLRGASPNQGGGVAHPSAEASA